MDEQVTAPIGFNITFPGLLSHAIDMGLEFPITQTDVYGILHLREMELKRFVNDVTGMKIHLVFPLCLRVRKNLLY